MLGVWQKVYQEPSVAARRKAKRNISVPEQENHLSDQLRFLRGVASLRRGSFSLLRNVVRFGTIFGSRGPQFTYSAPHQFSFLRCPTRFSMTRAFA